MRSLLLALGSALAVLASSCGPTAPKHVTSPPATGTLPAPATTVAPTVSPTAAPTSTTTAPDTSVVPKKITVAYVNAVFAKLDAVYSDAVRQAVKAKRITVGVERDLASIFSPRLLPEEYVIFEKSAKNGFPNIRPRPGNRLTTVTHLISASRSCVFAQVSIDQNPMTIRPVKATGAVYDELARRTIVERRARENGTVWVYAFNLVVDPVTLKVPDQCS
jgi:hypothetical protein